MNSPIILLVLWAVINILIKSSNDKKKAEEAQKKRQNQGLPPQRPSPRPKNIIDVFKEEIEREVQREKEAQQKKAKPSPKLERTPPPPKMEEVKRDLNYMDNQVNNLGQTIDENLEIVNVRALSQVERGKKLNLNIKKDILRGIIYSEILSEPKGLRNTKR